MTPRSSTRVTRARAPSARRHPRRGALARTLSAAVPLVLAIASLAWSDVGRAQPAPDFAPCRIGGEAASVRAACATLPVALDPDAPDAPDGARIELAIARVEARGRAPAPDPLVFVAGGPGQSARDAYASVAGAFAEIGRTRDVLLIDQRGTGGSHPLDCPDDDGGGEDGGGADAGDRPLGLPSTSAGEDLVAEAVADARACLASLDADPTLFTTSVAVRDLEAVRAALGIEAWNLYGVSYGTRAALHYARRYPSRVRSLVLDAVVPPGAPLGADIAPHAQRALDSVFARCAAEPGCAAAFPDVAERTEDLIEALADDPRTVVREDVATGRLQSEPFSREDLASTLRLLTYSAWGASILPSMLHAATAHDHLAPLARQTSMQSRALGASLATGMHRAVTCTEDLPFTDVEAAAAAAEGTYLGAEPIRALAAACEAWPRGRIDADFHDPLTLDVPALVLSGDADPVTPPAFGERLLTGLANARHVVNAGQGHVQAPLGCMPAIMARFLDAPDPAALELGCLERLSPPPFFVDANGPLP